MITQKTSFKNAEVVMMRRLLLCWKQPTFYDFDCWMTKSLLDEIIKDIKRLWCEVTVLGLDLDAGNQALWKELNININNSHFLNPFDKIGMIFFFLDVPYLLKLFQNRLLNCVLTLLSGTKIDKLLQVLSWKDKEELKLCPKISLKHVEVKGIEKMKVSFVAQIFSNHVLGAFSTFFHCTQKLQIFLN